MQNRQNISSVFWICLWIARFDYFAGITWTLVHLSDYLKNASNKMDCLGACYILVRIIFLEVSYESWPLLDNYGYYPLTCDSIRF